MKYVILAVIIVNLVGTTCVFQSAAQAPISTETATPTVTAVSGISTNIPVKARTATPTITVPNTFGNFDDPHDFRSFAARLDKAIQTADVQFFIDNVVFEDLKCDVDFPAPPKSCSEKPKGATVQGIVAGVWASEGFGLDASGYEALIREFLTNTDVSAFDAYGDPRPQLYAYGVFKPELRGSDVTKETVQAFATRVTARSESRIPPPGRSVLIVHVSFDGIRWSIARLTITPPVQQYPPAAALLDPSRPEAKEMLQYWRRWEPSPSPDPTKTVVPTGTATAPATAAVLFVELGSATLTADGNRTAVSISAIGLGPNTSHGAMIRTGTCAQGEAQDFSDVVFDLPALQANSAGVASIAATLDVPLDRLMDGNHKITIGMFAGRSRGADCGDIPKATSSR